MHLVGARQQRLIFQPSEVAEGNRKGWLVGEPVARNELPWDCAARAPTLKGLNLSEENSTPSGLARFLSAEPLKVHDTLYGRASTPRRGSSQAACNFAVT